MAIEALVGKTVLVTGAGRGIGAALAVGFGAAGASVVCAARTEHEIERVAHQILESGGDAIAVQTDVTNSGQVAELLEKTRCAYGGLDIVIANAGGNFSEGVFEAGDLADWRKTFDVNFFGAADLARQAVPYLKARGGGKILFTGSGLGHRGKAGFAVYGCSKAALWLLTQALAIELREFNIAVNELIPGPVNTGLAADSTTLGYEPIKQRLVMEGSTAHPNAVSLPGYDSEWYHEWYKSPADVIPLAMFVAGLPNYGPTAQSFSLMGRIG